MSVRDVIVLGFFLGSLPACFLRPYYGVLLWTIVAFLNPHKYAWGVAQTFPLAMAVGIPTLAGLPFFCKKLGNLVTPKAGLLAALWLWFTITTVVSTHTPIFLHHALETWDRWNFVSKVLLMTFVMLAVVNTFKRLRILVLVIAGCFAFFVLKSFPFLIATGGNFRVYGPDGSMIADNNDFGLAMNMTLPLFFFLAQTESNAWVRRLFGLVSVLAVPAIFFTYSRGALVGLIAVGALMFVVSKRRLLMIPVIIFGVTTALLFAPAAWKERMDLTGDNVMDNSAKGRINAWGYSWNLASDYPITGGGFATYTTELFSRYAPNSADFHGPHSVYFQLLGEQGFVGLGLYLFLVLNCFVTLRRVAKKARRRGDGVIVQYCKMFAFSLIGFLTSGVFLGRAYFDYYFTIVACVVILERSALERWEEADAGEGNDEGQALLDSGEELELEGRLPA